MPSRLSSLLVRDGLVGVKRMEKAFQRQVIYGGSLDTILLEMNLVPEERLTQYLALASGLPPAARDEGRPIGGRALDRARHARARRAVSRGAARARRRGAARARVLAARDLTELEDLADLLDRPLQPLITPEYRWHLVFATAYELDPPARFTTLARSLESTPATTPVGRARSVIVDGTRADPDAPPIPPQRDAPRRTQNAARRPADRAGRARCRDDADRSAALEIVVASRRATPRTHTLVGIAPNRATDPVGTGRAVATACPTIPCRGRAITFLTHAEHGRPESGDSEPTRRPSVPSPRQIKPRADRADRDRGSRLARCRSCAPARCSRPPRIATPCSSRCCARRARARGGPACSRCRVAPRSAASRSPSRASTSRAVAHRADPARRRCRRSARVVNNQQPHIGPLVSGDPGIDSMVLRLGGTMPPSALILPIVLRDRVVGDRRRASRPQRPPARRCHRAVAARRPPPPTRSAG